MKNRSGRATAPPRREPNFGTPEQRAADNHRHQLMIRRLNHSPIAGARRLAEVLADCRPGAGCGSGGCPVCGRDLQELGFDLTDRVILAPARDSARGRMSALTIVPRCGLAHPGRLTAEVCMAAMDVVRAAMQPLQSPAIAFLDVSFNEDAEDTVAPHWSAHLHGVVRDWPPDDEIAAIKAAFQTSRLVPRPVRFTPLDARDAGRLYPAKPERSRRVSYIDQSSPNRNPCRNTHIRDLRAWQAVQLALVEHQLGFARRMLLHRVDEHAARAILNALPCARASP